MTNQRKPRAAVSERTPAQRLGRQPQKAFINVLVRTSTRSALTRLKSQLDLPSQGEVIDYLVVELRKRSRAT